MQITVSLMVDIRGLVQTSTRSNNECKKQVGKRCEKRHSKRYEPQKSKGRPARTAEVKRAAARGPTDGSF